MGFMREDAVPDVTPKMSREQLEKFVEAARQYAEKVDRENAIREAVAAERARCIAVARQMIARAEEARRGGSYALGLTRDQWLAGAVVAAEIIEEIENPEAPNG